MSDIFDFETTAYLKGAGAVVTFTKPTSLFVRPTREPIPFEVSGNKYRGYVYWGSNNNLPAELCDKIYSNPVVSSAMEFKSALTFGDGIMAIKKSVDPKTNEIKITPVFDCEPINEFFDNNDINGYLLDQATDLQMFYNIFPEIILNNENSPKVVQLNHKEAMFSRWEEMNPNTGQIENHFYSALWDREINPTDMVATPVLSKDNPLMDLKYRLGIGKDPLGKVSKSAERRFIIPISFPSPGRFYYRKPYWISIIESGWYDFVQKIPEFKMALLNNGMVLKYHVEIHPEFFKQMFKDKGATTDVKKKEVRTAWFTNLNDFLSKPENAGKTFVSEYYVTPDEKEYSMVKINLLSNEFKGGEYLGDLQEGSSILSYGCSVHPSMIGSQPGKNSTINGTEARELWIIKQAMLKPFRDRLLYPLNIIKAINGWPKDIYFTIPNIELTTLDQGTGAKKTISQPALQ